MAGADERGGPCCKHFDKPAPGNLAMLTRFDQVSRRPSPVDRLMSGAAYPKTPQTSRQCNGHGGLCPW